MFKANEIIIENNLDSSCLQTVARFTSCLLQPETEAEAGAGGEGTSAAAVKRGLSLEAAAAGQDVKRFRTAAGAASTVTKPPLPKPSETKEMRVKAPEKILCFINCAVPCNF